MNAFIWLCLPFGDVYSITALGKLANTMNEEVDVLRDQTLLLLQTFF